MTEENFSSPSIRTCSKAHPATYSMHIFGNLPGIKATWNNYFRSSFVVQRLRMCGVTSSASNHGVVFNKWDGKNLPFFTFQTYQINRCLSLKRVLLSKKQFKYFFLLILRLQSYRKQSQQITEFLLKKVVSNKEEHVSALSWVVHVGMRDTFQNHAIR